MKNMAPKNDRNDIPCWGDIEDANYIHPTTSGNKHIPSGGKSGQILRWSSDGTAAWEDEKDTTYDTFKGASSSTAGSAGLVPAPAAGKQTAFLRGDGTWAVPTNTTYGNMTGATIDAAGKAGLVPAPTAGAATRYLRSDGTWQVPPDTNTTYATMTAATASAAGKAGLVPAPAAGKQTSFLRGDGTWVIPTNTTYGVATTSANGLMSSTDKTKLNGIAEGANKYTHPTTAGNMHIPSGGAAGNLLIWSAAGAAKWEAGYIVKSDANGYYIEV